ncbi:hypothetical protein Airi01_067780 [Actinoallomurus iriomotensis]|uniref:Uncharacterized protein n=1 Tax=Actinoallomurus iriomotensis TaxID=478107 RepID=A0A9W6RM97_9ACTN|nr:hypothetical protein Airi01_067780 [Actinoallomurus iriomotensis]
MVIAPVGIQAVRAPSWTPDLAARIDQGHGLDDVIAVPAVNVTASGIPFPSQIKVFSSLVRRGRPASDRFWAAFSARTCELSTTALDQSS